MAKFPTTDEFVKKVAEKALDEYEYDGKSIREWAELVTSGNLREERHGSWLIDGRCSECLANPLTTHKNFCPNCGAKMYGGSKNGY